MKPTHRDALWIADRYQWYAAVRQRPINYAIGRGTCELIMGEVHDLPKGETIVDAGSGLSSVMLHRAWERYVHTIDLDPSFLAQTMGDVAAAQAKWPDDPSCTFHAFSVLDRENPHLKKHQNPVGLLVWDLGYPEDRAPFLPLFLDAYDDPRVIVLDDWHFEEAGAMRAIVEARGYEVTVERERTLDFGARFAAVARKS